MFSFLRNPEGVAAFIAELRVCFDNHTPVWVVLKRVTEIDYDCITVLLSVMVRFKSQNIKFDGDFPKDKNVRRVLVESRFFEHLYKGKFRDSEKYELTEKSSIVTHAMKSVDPELGASLIKAASRTIWGHYRRCPGVQRTFIELMQNTNNHASMTQEGEKHWWLSIRHEEAERKVRFSFVDYGVGVFFNLQNKRNDNKFFRILELLHERFRYGNNAEVLRLIFSGELHRTASGKSFRGKGLPGVYEAFSEGKISNLALITNNVFFNSMTNEYRILDTEFQGTFISWELGIHNHSLPDED